MPAFAYYARESDCKDTLKCINFNVLAQIFSKNIFLILSLWVQNPYGAAVYGKENRKILKI